MNDSQLINQDSGNTEYYTPQEIIEAARRTMGCIDLDPFSSAKANERVKASVFMGEQAKPLEKPWWGNVWQNHPFSRSMNKACIEKLINEYENLNIDQACCVTFAATSEKWFKPLLNYPQCYLHGRTNYYLPDGTLKKGVTKGSVVTYLGNDVESFAKNFKCLGTIKVKYED